MPIPMGIGRLGFNNLIFKRKFRWTFEVFDICGGKSVPRHYVKLAARPNLTVEETEINHLNAKTWIPGKAAWETISVTYYDVATLDNRNLFDWIASVYEFTNPGTLKMGANRSQYAGRGVILLYDGCGNELERWQLLDMWPQAVNFGELDYSNSEEATIELTLRYGGVDYESLCPAYTPTNCCTPCNAGIASTGSGGKLPNTGSNFG